MAFLKIKTPRTLPLMKCLIASLACLQWIQLFRLHSLEHHGSLRSHLSRDLPAGNPRTGSWGIYGGGAEGVTTWGLAGDAGAESVGRGGSGGGGGPYDAARKKREGPETVSVLSPGEDDDGGEEDDEEMAVDAGMSLMYDDAPVPEWEGDEEDGAEGDEAEDDEYESEDVPMSLGLGEFEANARARAYREKKASVTKAGKDKKKMYLKTKLQQKKVGREIQDLMKQMREAAAEEEAGDDYYAESEEEPKMNWGGRPGQKSLGKQERLQRLLTTKINLMKRLAQGAVVEEEEEEIDDSDRIPLLRLPPAAVRPPWPPAHPLHGLRLSDTRKNPPGGSMAACILVKDDADLLAEWIPYHYHTLPLRDLVIAVDPGNTQSLDRLRDRWDRPDELGLSFAAWDDDVYLPAEFPRFPDLTHHRTELKKMEAAANHHYERQRYFFGACVEHMRARHRTWTLFIDSDEYLVFNTPHADDGTLQRECTPDKTCDDTKKRYAILKKPFWHNADFWNKRAQEMAAARATLPANGGGTTAGDDGRRTGGSTAMQYLTAHADAPPFHDRRPCVDVPRLFFGGVDSRPADVAADVPAGFDAGAFNTLRYRRHARRGAFEYNLFVKTLADVSRIDVAGTPRKELPNGFKVLDKKTVPWRWRPFQMHKLCSRSAFGDIPVYYDQSPFRAHHYIGSWEAYSARKDSRRTKSMYDIKANVDEGSDDDIRPWLKNFVHEFGDYAKELTSKVVDTSDYLSEESSDYLSEESSDYISEE